MKAQLLVTTNWAERNQAEKLNIKIPDAIQKTTDLLFYVEDVKRAFVEESGSIMMVMGDDAYLEIKYEERIWKKLEKCFKENED